MIIEDINHYLSEHKVEKVNIGKSGANVYIIDNTYILKHANRDMIQNDEIWGSYVREASFYKSVNKTSLPCIPDVEYVENTPNEVILLMKKYNMVDQTKLTYEMLTKIMNALVMIHTYPIPDFLKKNNSTVTYMKSEQIQDCVSGWEAVLDEHPGIFDIKPLENIATDINKIIKYNHTNEQTLVHGDFHCENILVEDNSKIIICDWQGAGAGRPAGDISFFISRLSGANVNINEQDIISLYCECYQAATGVSISENKIKMQMDATNLITSFMFWHQYLHGSDINIVRNIYSKMFECSLEFNNN